MKAVVWGRVTFDQFQCALQQNHSSNTALLAILLCLDKDQCTIVTDRLHNRLSTSRTVEVLVLGPESFTNEVNEVIGTNNIKSSAENFELIFD